MRFAPSLLLLAMLGCSEGSGPAGPVRHGIGRDCPEDSFLTYENFGQPFMLNWCTGCHSSTLSGDEIRADAPEGFDFDDPNLIRPHLEEIYERAVERRNMPPAGGPGDAERDLLGEWLACGAPSDFDVWPE
ncbi:MAG: hypothetical protein AAGE52_08960 [Myxococcota bacterium]